MKKKKKISFDLIQLGSVLALPVAIGKSHQGKPCPPPAAAGRDVAQVPRRPPSSPAGSAGRALPGAELSPAGLLRDGEGNSSPELSDRFTAIPVLPDTAPCAEGQASSV